MFRKIKMAFQRGKNGYCEEDLWNISDWFLRLIPKMLSDFKKDTCGIPNSAFVNYFKEHSELGTYEDFRCNWNRDVEKEVKSKWEKDLDRMIFCFNEGKPETCTKKNKYEQEWLRVYDEFEKQFGSFGEKIPQPEENKKRGLTTIYFPDSPEVGNKEWKEVVQKWRKEDIKIHQYREKMVDEGLQLFKDYFWDLWD